MKKPLAGWIEIFRTGKHVDSSGHEQEFSRADLDRTVSLYQPDQHEAPAVIGHPGDNAPAYAWVERLQRSGDTMLAKFKQIEPAFAELLEAGRFKKRSISLYPDGSLRHVGFLGAQPPAIKGLKDFAFNQDEECFCYEYEEVDMNEVEKLKKKLEEQQGLTAAAKAEAREFKEKAEKATTDFAEAERQRQRDEIRDFVEQGIKDGKILPAWKEAGLGEFMEALAGVAPDNATLEFAEGDNRTKVDPADWLKKFITSFAEHPLFKEMVKPDKKDDKAAAEFAEAEEIAKNIADSVKS